MALADSVPGVSGGTVAFLLGFYDNFIGSLNDLMTGNLEAKKKALIYLVKLGIGWAIGMIASILVLTSVFESHIYQISSLFIGFILFAIPVVIYQERACLKEKLWTAFMALLGAGGVWALTYFTVGDTSRIVSFEHASIGTYIYVFIAGAIAICAMVLPGISGSTLLLIFGLYISIISAIKETLTLNLQYLPILIVFGIGVITGIVSIVRLIRIALEKWRSATVFLIIGMMLGSLYSVIMGPTTLTDDNKLSLGLEPLSFSSFHILFFIIGGVIIIGLQLLGSMKSNQQQEN
ncbi:MAG: DUF368 domain-containing protein [Oscillospiraceae bacterium]|nr:DUF368 domain-containing protein [Oscillospiraceae bacterium]MDE6776450.1 DUF368 domain-containing protein [Oscillospiraceae bacterium]